MRDMEGVGGVVNDVCIYSRGECLQVGVNLCTVKCDRQEHKLNITMC